MGYLFPRLLSDQHVSHVTLVLLAVDVVVLPQENGRDTEDEECGRGDAVDLLAVAPGVVDGVAGRRADRILHLGQVATKVDGVGLVLEVVGQAAAQGIGEGGRVDGLSDGVADGATKAVEEVEDGEHQRDTVTVRGSHDSHALADNQGATTKRDKDLAHDNVANVGVLATEADHETGAEQHHAQAEEERGPLEVLGVADVDTKDGAPEAGADVVDLGHVARLGDAEVIDDNDKLVVVEVPGIEAVVDDAGHGAGTDDSPLLEELPADEVDAGKVLLPDGKDGEQQQADDDHGDKRGRVVVGAAVGGHAEGQQEQDPGSHEDETTDQVKLVCVVEEGLDHGAAALDGHIEAELLGLELVELEDEGERREDEELDDAEGTDTPAPGRVVQERLGGQGTGEGGADKGRGHKGERKGTVLEAGRISDENVHDKVQGVVADPVEDVAGSVAVRAVAGSNNDHAEQVDTDKDKETLGTTPDVEDLGNGQLQDATDNRGQNASRSDLGRGLERGVGVDGDVAEDGLLESEHEETDPDPGVAGDDGAARPDEGGSLGLLDTNLGIRGHPVAVPLDLEFVAGLETEARGVFGR
ncbi:hypothetical protein F503_03672 [Ophiostoma piceae UAMH 11346]|uniref:Uncharacterized protein n=1 Tax=Ophiostoma piceae (strain UAMH 11346) TaxID=1262450 RepID=S3CV36_OPHP1|nr:hypothetical protein F503_03672 [Ophiostoma piceae UAMH 11346]